MDSDITDETLMLNYVAGDVAAFETLYLRHKGAVYRYLLRLSNNRAIAEELFQDVWMKLIQARESYIASAKFTTYLYKLAHNHFIDHYRKTTVRIVEETSIEPNDIEHPNELSNEPESYVRTSELTNKIKSLLVSLPNEQREVFLLKEEAGMSVPEIAETIGINKEAAKSRLRYAIMKLRQGLADE